MAAKHPALRQLFAPYQSLTVADLPVFEVALIGGMVNIISGFANAPSVTQRQAAEVFGLIPAASAIAVRPDAAVASSWNVDDVDGLHAVRSAIISCAPSIANEPDNLLLRLVPVLQTQLTNDAGNPTTQIRMAFLRTMTELARPGEHGLTDDELHRILVDTIHRHEQAGLDQQP